LSHHPIVAIARLPFPRDLTDPKDTEDRVAVWAQVAMSDSIVEIAVTHLSLSLTARERSVRRLVDWLWRQSDAPKILMGDLNDAPHSPTLRFLLAEATPPFADAWALAHPDEHGFTFPSHAPQHRIDYVLFTPPDAFVVDDIRLVGDTPDADGIYPSDHLGIVATLQVEARRANGR
jgi:beta-glucosidase